MTSTPLGQHARTPDDVARWSRASQYESQLRREHRANAVRTWAATFASLVAFAAGVYYATGATP